MSVCSPNYGADGKFPCRWCIVPECESSSVKTPDKLWIEAPTDLDTRMIWLNLALRDPKKLPTYESQMYFCEDHFNLENDMENYEQYKTMGSVERVQMKPNCIPNKFDCQSDRISHQQPHEFLVCSPNTQPVSIPTQTKMPILLTLLTEDNCNSCQDVTNTALLVKLFCVCCLARDVPFVSLVTCCHAEFLNSMIMPEIKPKNQVICYQCHNMLKKIKQFKLQVEESFKLLSDSSENIPKNSNQRLNYRRQNFSMAISDANRKEKPMKYYNATTPHTIRIKPSIPYDHIIDEEKIEAKDKTKKNSTPKSSEKKDKQTKMIKEAFKIINNNQNSESINLLANSLQTLSATLLSDMIYPNFDLGNQFDTSPAEIKISGNSTLSSNKTTSSTENITCVTEENTFITDSTNIAVCPAISTADITDGNEENAFQDDSINVATKDICTDIILGEIAFKAESSNIATNLAISTENLNNKITEVFTNADIPTENKNSLDSPGRATNPAISTENLTKNNTEILLGFNPMNDYINFTNSTMSIEEIINNNKEDDSLPNDERIICDTYGLGDNVAGEEFIQPVKSKQASIGEELESVGGGESNARPVVTPIALDKRPILGGNIKQLTLTREQLMEERAKTAASQAYLRAPHKCQTCIIGFQFSENLDDHIKRKHKTGKRHVILCDVCRQFVDYGFSYDKHTFWHYTRYQCVFCEQLFASYDKAALHHRKLHSKIRYRHKVKKGVTFKCPRCPYKTGRKLLLRDHMSECSTCKQCGVTIGSTTDVTLETHLTYCTGAPSEAKRAKLTPTSTTTKALEN